MCIVGLQRRTHRSTRISDLSPILIVLGTITSYSSVQYSTQCNTACFCARVAESKVLTGDRRESTRLGCRKGDGGLLDNWLVANLVIYSTQLEREIEGVGRRKEEIRELTLTMTTITLDSFKNSLNNKLLGRVKCALCLSPLFGCRVQSAMLTSC